jgi:pimeloyl-ACP methyl ester carboxylesterase
LSSVATRYQLGLVLHAGSLIVPLKHAPDAQRAMANRAASTVVEAKGSHAIYLSQPKAVAALIEQAASKDKGAAVAW